MVIYVFLMNSLLLGVGLAMDAFSVSIANGIHNPAMDGQEKMKIAGVFAGFQLVMPMIGWGFVHFLFESFAGFQVWIPWIALVLLSYIGGKMIYEAVTCKDDSEQEDDSRDAGLSNRDIIIQGIATSIDALSVGFTIADYKLYRAFLCSSIIGIVTFIICEIGLRIGIKVGMKLARKASILGGIILIAIGIEIFIKGFFLS